VLLLIRVFIIIFYSIVFRMFLTLRTSSSAHAVYFLWLWQAAR